MALVGLVLKSALWGIRCEEKWDIKSGYQPPQTYSSHFEGTRKAIFGDDESKLAQRAINWTTMYRPRDGIVDALMEGEGKLPYERLLQLTFHLFRTLRRTFTHAIENYPTMVAWLCINAGSYAMHPRLHTMVSFFVWGMVLSADDNAVAIRLFSPPVLQAAKAVEQMTGKMREHICTGRQAIWVGVTFIFLYGVLAERNLLPKGPLSYALTIVAASITGHYSGWDLESPKKKRSGGLDVDSPAMDERRMESRSTLVSGGDAGRHGHGRSDSA